MVSLDAAVRQRPDVELTDLTDALILSQSSERTVFGVNGAGRRIVHLLAAPQTVDAIVAVLAREFRVDPKQCEADVREFLTELGERGFIENC